MSQLAFKQILPRVTLSTQGGAESPLTMLHQPVAILPLSRVGGAAAGISGAAHKPSRRWHRSLLQLVGHRCS